MLIRISLIVAIVAGLAAGALNFVKVKEKITTLQANLKEQTEGRQKAETDLASTRRDLDRTNAVLKTTIATLEATTAERDKAVADAAAKTKETERLTEDLKKTTDERNTAQAEVASYRATGYTTEQIIAAKTKIKGLEDSVAGLQAENGVLGNDLKKTKVKLLKYEDPNYFVPLPARLRGKILVADPKWNFVVLNVGEDQGVLESGEMLVNRNGKLVAKIIVRSVQKDRSVANVMPGWQVGEVMEGDQVIPAHPAS